MWRKATTSSLFLFAVTSSVLLSLAFYPPPPRVLFFSPFMNPPSDPNNLHLPLLSRFHALFFFPSVSPVFLAPPSQYGVRTEPSSVFPPAVRVFFCFCPFFIPFSFATLCCSTRSLTDVWDILVVATLELFGYFILDLAARMGGSNAGGGALFLWGFSSHRASIPLPPPPPFFLGFISTYF